MFQLANELNKNYAYHNAETPARVYWFGYVNKRNSRQSIVGTNLVGTPVPDGRYGETKEDTGPRQTAIVSGANKMQGIVRRNATAELRMIHIKQTMLDRRVWNCAHEVVHYRLKPAGLHKSCSTSNSLSQRRLQ